MEETLVANTLAAVRYPNQTGRRISSKRRDWAHVSGAPNAGASKTTEKTAVVFRREALMTQIRASCKEERDIRVYPSRQEP